MIPSSALREPTRAPQRRRYGSRRASCPASPEHHRRRLARVVRSSGARVEHERRARRWLIVSLPLLLLSRPGVRRIIASIKVSGYERPLDDAIDLRRAVAVAKNRHSEKPDIGHNPSLEIALRSGQSANVAEPMRKFKSPTSRRSTPRITCRRMRSKPGVDGQVHAVVKRHLSQSGARDPTIWFSTIESSPEVDWPAQ